MQALKIICLCVCFSAGGWAATLAPPPVIQTTDSADTGLEFVPLEDKIQVIPKPKAGIEDAAFWRNIGNQQLKKVVDQAKKSKDPNFQRKAKNIIVFIGDGMGMSSITMGRIFKGQYLKHGNGEEESLVFDNFPHTGLAKTYNVDKQVPDSAATATAMFTGVKTDYGAIGMDITRNITDATQGSLSSIMEWAQSVGKRTGIVTTTRITHATPAATYAQVYNRNWECDSLVPAESVGKYMDIAQQLVDKAPGNKFNVIMGGGLSAMGAFNTAQKTTAEYDNDTDSICRRNDGRNLTKDWLQQAGANDSRVFVQNSDQLMKVDLKNTNRLMGIFRNSHITYSVSRQEGEPTLKEMTEAAIKVLDRGTSSEGYVLMVEAGRIDMAHHQNWARAAMHEMLEFDRAIEAALEAIDPAETLIIVTADHSHAVTLNGYPLRGNDILGFANAHLENQDLLYETITYANGPGYYDHMNNGTQATNMMWMSNKNISKPDFTAPAYRHMAMFPLKDETHGGEDVVVFAQGPGASLVRGVFEQNYLAYVMSYAGCFGPAKDFDATCQPNYVPTSAAGQLYNLPLLLLPFLALLTKLLS